MERQAFLFYNHPMEREQKKILIVDDSTYLRSLKGTYLKRRTCSIVEAKDGEKALHVLVEEKPDLIIMDLSMPLVNGDECCRVIKNHPDYNHIPVIMLANTWEKDAEKRCKEAGCDDFISKPVKRERLYWSIKQYLNIAERIHPRTPFEAKAVVSASGIDYRGVSANISQGGIFIRSNEIHTPGSAIQLKLSLNPRSKDYIVDGQVAWAATEEDTAIGLVPGMGIQFKRLNPDFKELIKNKVR